MAPALRISARIHRETERAAEPDARAKGSAHDRGRTGGQGQGLSAPEREAVGGAEPLAAARRPACEGATEQPAADGVPRLPMLAHAAVAPSGADRPLRWALYPRAFILRTCLRHPFEPFDFRGAASAFPSVSGAMRSSARRAKRAAAATGLLTTALTRSEMAAMLGSPLLSRLETSSFRNALRPERLRVFERAAEGCTLAVDERRRRAGLASETLAVGCSLARASGARRSGRRRRA